MTWGWIWPTGWKFCHFLGYLLVLYEKIPTIKGDKRVMYSQMLCVGKKEVMAI